MFRYSVLLISSFASVAFAQSGVADHEKFVTGFGHDACGFIHNDCPKSHDDVKLDAHHEAEIGFRIRGRAFGEAGVEPPENVVREAIERAFALANCRCVGREVLIQSEFEIHEHEMYGLLHVNATATFACK